MSDGTNEIILNNLFADAANQLVNNAKSELRICAYAWRWYENKPESNIQSFNASLSRARARGVVVRVLCDTEELKQMLIARGFQARNIGDKRTLHAKVLCAGTDEMILGSHNYTMRAFNDNLEVSIRTREFEPIAQFVEYFDKLWNSYG